MTVRKQSWRLRERDEEEQGDLESLFTLTGDELNYQFVIASGSKQSGLFDAEK